MTVLNTVNNDGVHGDGVQCKTLIWKTYEKYYYIYSFD